MRRIGSYCPTLYHRKEGRPQVGCRPMGYDPSSQERLGQRIRYHVGCNACFSATGLFTLCLNCDGVKDAVKSLKDVKTGVPI